MAVLNIGVCNLRQSNKDKAIIFDMDHTIIRSSIDFSLMRWEVNRLLQKAKIEPPQTSFISSVLSNVQHHPAMTPELWRSIMHCIDEIETAGLMAATAEQNVDFVLKELQKGAYLFVLTNNLQQAAERVLDKLNLLCYFDRVVGRGVMPALKPDPAGIYFIRQYVVQIPKERFLMIGDSLIDILVAYQAGIQFVAYNNSREENWQTLGQVPLVFLKNWDEQALQELAKVF